MKNPLNAFGIIRGIENWQEYLFSFLGMPPKDDFIKLRNGISYKIRKNSTDKWMIEEIWIRKDYTPPGFEIPDNATVVDVGAHIGSFALFAASYAKSGRVLSFEPFRGSHELLVHNIRLNGFKNIKAVNLGLSDRKEKIKLYLPEDDSCRNTVFIEHPDFAEISCITLKDLFRDYGIKHCDFLKLDCEGAEYAVLLSTPDEIFQKIDRISLEHHDHLVKKHNHRELQDFLEGKGFAVTVEGPMLYAKKK